MFENFFEGFEFSWKREGLKLNIFGPTLIPRFPLKIAEIEKNKRLCGKTLAVGLSKYFKIKTLSPLPFLGKIQLLFAIFGLFFSGVTTQRGRIKV